MKKFIYCFLLILAGCGGGGGSGSVAQNQPPIANQPPTASFTASPTTGPAPLDVTFDAAGSSDSDGSIAEYAWDFGDGQTGAGIMVAHNFANAGNRSFAAGIEIASSGASTVMLGDVDGDGDLDLVIANQGQPNHLHLNDGAGNFSDATDIGTNEFNQNQPLDARLGDVNGDGAPDLVGANQSGPNDLFLNDGAGNFGLRIDIDTDGNMTRSVVLGDVDSDGDLDLIAGNFATNRLYLNDGVGNFGPGSDITSDADDTWSMVLGDVNGDGAPDFIAGNPVATNRLYLNDGTGNFGPGTDIAADSDSTFSVALGDVNGDGALDLITGNQNTVINRLYLNDGAGNFGVGSEITADSDLTNSVVLGDTDNDGDLDMIAGNTGGMMPPGISFNRLYLNDGTGNFAAGVDIDSDGDSTSSVVLGDVNGDGDLDLIAGNAGPNRLYSNIGTFTVTLTVTDDNGATALTTREITVAP